ncbi:MAG: hypothetical protein AAFY67_10660 [Cyanobacteria bacterium J06642_9]
MKNWYGSDFKCDGQRLTLKGDRVNQPLEKRRFRDDWGCDR